MRHISHLANLLKIKKSTMGKHSKSSENGHDACPKWERCLPNMGKHLAPDGQNLFHKFDLGLYPYSQILHM